jgi:4-hydroxybenzoate polyprenyltransferase
MSGWTQVRYYVLRALSSLMEYVRLTRLDKPVGIWLLLWPTLWALWIAGRGRPDERVFAIFLAGVVVMRSAGCAINDYADRRIDPKVARTRQRPLAAGRISGTEAIVLYVLLSLVALGLVLNLDPLTQKYSLAGAVLALVYPFLKRVTSLPQVWLGLAFSWSIPMAFTALTGGVPRVAWLLFIAAALWTVVYDTIYAMVDRVDDLRAGVRSTATLFGDADRVILGILQVLVVATLVLVGKNLGFGRWYAAGLACAALCFVWQQWMIRDRDPAGCFRAFVASHYFGLCVFAGIALDYLYRHH